jgi:cold-inducible RNA-binding protein
MMSKKLYVGNLPFTMDEDGLKALFADGGWETDEVVLISHRDTGRSRGFGFVTLVNDDDASEAIAKLNESDIDGRNIVVNEARERQDRDR